MPKNIKHDLNQVEQSLLKTSVDNSSGNVEQTFFEDIPVPIEAQQKGAEISQLKDGHSPPEVTKEHRRSTDRNLFTTFEIFSTAIGTKTLTTSTDENLTSTPDVFSKPDVSCVPEMCFFYATDPYNTSTDSANSDKVLESQKLNVDRSQPRLTRLKEKSQQLQELKVLVLICYSHILHRCCIYMYFSDSSN